MINRINNLFPKVSIIILNWNGLADTLECLESLRKIDYKNYDVILVDNNSSGDDVKILTERFENYIAKIISNNDNLGFSGGNNVGIKYALDCNADVVLLLNNDTVVEPDFLSKLVHEANKNLNASIITPMINYYTNKNIIWFAGGFISKIRSSGFPFGIGKKEKHYLKNRYCTFASGCCMYIKKEVIEKIGLLDENYFLYLEDSDYSYRAYKTGLKILYAPSSRIYHKVSATTSRAHSFLALYYGTRNRLYFAKKNLNWYYNYSIFLYLLLTSTLKVLFFSKRFEAMKIIKRAFIDIRANRMGKNNIFL
ncbi:MAG: glycosyltransferase family 2 protein [Melioribacteraceae bacterium]